MTELRVKVRNALWSRRHLYAKYMYIPEFYLRVGQQVDPPKWAEPGTICLTTGDPNFPVRTIHPSLIVSINDEENIPQNSVDTETRVVEVKGGKGQTYHVTITAHSRSCTCPGYMFRRSCRHISEA